MFCSVFPSGSDETIVRVKRSSGVILAIFGHFCKIEKARIGAISWADICSVWTPLSIFKNLARWHPVQKSYSRFQFYGSIAKYKLYRITYTTGRTAKSSSSPGWVYLCGHIVSVMLFHSPNQEIESIIPDHYGFY